MPVNKVGTNKPIKQTILILTHSDMGEVLDYWNSKSKLNEEILYLTESQIEFIKLIDKKLHKGLSGYTLIDDITEDVLYERFDTSVFGFFEFEMKFDFFKYRQENLTKDDVLDKMLKYGKESLTENDKLLLEDKQMISPIDEI